MGAGTGPLRDMQPYHVTLTFDSGGIDEHDPVYEHFSSALQWLLQGLWPAGASGTMTPHVDPGGTVTSIDVEVLGPLADPTNFNRAFNRLLWGTKHRRGEFPRPVPTPHPPTDSGRTVTPRPHSYQNENT